MLRALRLPALVCLLCVTAACSQSALPERAGRSAEVVAAPAPTPAPRAVAASAAGESIDFAGLVSTLSEPDASFFSENYISNETSYLQIAPALERSARPGGVYLGVGPEQNFSYIALTRPELAFVVDIRRENMLLHLLYRAVFDEATSRSHFVALLLGRPWSAESAPPADASVDQVLAHATRSPPSDATLAETHARLRARILDAYGVKLDAGDLESLAAAHRAFHKGQLELRFELHDKNGRQYPTLRELLSRTDADGRSAGFLASEPSFRFVQRLEREGRIVPVVGDFAGERALPGIAAWLREHRLEVSTFYVSNVEQYLFEPGMWARWSRNLAALPVHEESLLVRCWLDQGRRHPAQMKGHRTATTLHRMAPFVERQRTRPSPSWWAVATEDVFAPLPAQPTGARTARAAD
ncbi:MAG: hypothetical protein WKG00_19705 [Polyangiaceae bacterium]